MKNPKNSRSTTVIGLMTDSKKNQTATWELPIQNMLIRYYRKQLFCQKFDLMRRLTGWFSQGWRPAAPFSPVGWEIMTCGNQNHSSSYGSVSSPDPMHMPVTLLLSLWHFLAVQGQTYRRGSCDHTPFLKGFFPLIQYLMSWCAIDVDLHFSYSL